jgi:hypothetical protein
MKDQLDMEQSRRIANSSSVRNDICSSKTELGIKIGRAPGYTRFEFNSLSTAYWVMARLARGWLDWYGSTHVRGATNLG